MSSDVGFMNNGSNDGFLCGLSSRQKHKQLNPTRISFHTTNTQKETFQHLVGDGQRTTLHSPPSTQHEEEQQRNELRPHDDQLLEPVHVLVLVRLRQIVSTLALHHSPHINASRVTYTRPSLLPWNQKMLSVFSSDVTVLNAFFDALKSTMHRHFLSHP